MSPVETLPPTPSYYIKSFGVQPTPLRDDGVPFTRADLYEGGNPIFALAALIDTFTFSPVDSDPLKPMVRKFTTAKSRIESDAFYWLNYVDASGASMLMTPMQIVDKSLSMIELLVRSEFPMTWDGLAGTNYLGLATLRLRISNVKYTLLPDTIAAQDDSTYTTTLRVYIAKMAALDLIGPGIEYWMRQKTTLGTTGTNENKTLPDPIAGLRELGKRLAAETQVMAGNPAVTQFATVAGEAPAVSGAGEMVTQDPMAFPIEFTPYETQGTRVQ